MVEEREREIRRIVQSISDLSEIFRDLGAMIVEQVCEVTCLIHGVSSQKSWSFSKLLIMHCYQEKNLNLFP